LVGQSLPQYNCHPIEKSPSLARALMCVVVRKMDVRNVKVGQVA